MGKAAPVIVTVVAVVASIYAGPQVGAAILEGMGVTGASAATTAAVGGAAISGSTSAVNAAVNGKDVNGILEAGAKGAGSGAVGGYVGAQVPAGEAVGRGIASGATSGATSAALNRRDPITGAIVGGVSGGVTGGIMEGFADPNIGDVEAQEGGFYGEKGVNEPLINPELQRFIAQTGGRIAGTFTARELADTSGGGSGTTYQPSAGGATTQPIGEPTLGIGAPGSAALGQALRIGSGEPGAPIESPGGGESATRPVWNIASLRVKDETGG
jgi:hypothetical protein